MVERSAIHSFFTEGYSDWAELFITSMLHHNPNVSIYIDTFNLSPETIEYFEKGFPSVNFYHNHETLIEISNNLDCTPILSKELLQSVESGIVDNRNYQFKVYISVEKRYKRLLELIKSGYFSEFDSIIHCDIDLYIRHDLSHLMTNLKNNDFMCLIRNSKDERWRILGAFLCINLNSRTSKFINDWLNLINAIDILKRPRGFGQLVISQALALNKKLKIHNFANDSDPILSKEFNQKSAIWLNSNYKVKNINCKNERDLGRYLSWHDFFFEQTMNYPIQVTHEFRRFCIPLKKRLLVKL